MHGAPQFVKLPGKNSLKILFCFKLFGSSLPFRGFRRCRDDSCNPAREIHSGLRYSDPVCACTHAYVTCLNRLHTSHESHDWTAWQQCQLELLLCTAVQEWCLHRARGPFLPGRALLPPVAVPAAPSHTISCLLHETTKIFSVAETRTTIKGGRCSASKSFSELCSWLTFVLIPGWVW